jgi:uncharacterized damage-inducible protein DinB
MKRAVVVGVIVTSVASVGLRAQATYPYIAELKQNYGFIKNNHLRMAEKMPEEHYGFKPAAEIRSFGEALAHVADMQVRSCTLVSGEQKTVDAAAKKTRAELIAALKASFAICDAVLDGLTDAGASEMVRLGQSTRTRSKLGLLIGMVSHANEEYGYMAVYLRLKGIVPPSSENQQ